MKRFTRVALSATLVTAAVFAVPQTAQAEGPDPSSSYCEALSTPVKLQPSDTTTYTVKGRICRSQLSSRVPPFAVEVLVPGSTYDRNYWNTSYTPGMYSYVHEALRHNYASFRFDRLGTG